MSAFSRSGHWRRSANGGVHWVSSHVVSRDLWDPGVACQPGLHGLGSGHESYASFVFPNTRCPVCEAPVFFYKSPSGGRVFFDELGPPWPKHGCTDNASPVTHRPGGTRVETRSASGWRPVSVKGVEWAEDAAIVRATLSLGRSLRGDSLHIIGRRRRGPRCARLGEVAERGCRSPKHAGSGGGHPGGIPDHAGSPFDNSSASQAEGIGGGRCPAVLRHSPPGR